MPITEFFLSYRKVDMRADEVLVSVSIPWCREHEYFEAYKQARRRDDDIAIVGAGMRLLLVSDMCSKGCDGKCATGCPTARFLVQLSAAGWQVVVAEAFQYCDDPEIVRLARTDPLNFADGMEEDGWAAIWELELCAPPDDR